MLLKSNSLQVAINNCARHGLSHWREHQKDYGICRAPAHQVGAGFLYEAMAKTILHKFKQLHTIKEGLRFPQNLAF